MRKSLEPAVESSLKCPKMLAIKSRSFIYDEWAEFERNVTEMIQL